MVLAGREANTWTMAARRVSSELGVPLEAYRFELDLSGGDGANAHGIESDGALLVRPDGFVAWRNAHGAADPAAQLKQALRSILARPELQGAA